MYRQYLSDSWWLLQWEWQWLITFTFPRRVSRARAMGKMMEWIRKLQKREHMQVGGFYCLVVKNGHSHLHLVLLGDGKRNDQRINLTDVDSQIWTDEWSRRRVLRDRNIPAEIKVVESSETASSYLANHNFESKADDVEIYPYNQKLLKRFRKDPPSIHSRRPNNNCNRLQKGGSKNVIG